MTARGGTDRQGKAPGTYTRRSAGGSLGMRARSEALQAFYRVLRPGGRVNPRLDFYERDLVPHPEQAGFADIDLELRVTVKNGRPRRSCVWLGLRRVLGLGFLGGLPAVGSQRRSWRILSLLTWKTAPIWSRVQPSSLSW